MPPMPGSTRHSWTCRGREWRMPLPGVATRRPHRGSPPTRPAATRGGIDAGIAVLVQPMVQARAAGVAFTANPVTGDRSETIVTAVRGLGERLVGGEASEMSGASAAEMSSRADRRAAISSEQARAIARLARRAESGVRCRRRTSSGRSRPTADAGWRLLLLQARPMTALPPEAVVGAARSRALVPQLPARGVASRADDTAVRGLAPPADRGRVPRRDARQHRRADPVPVRDDQRLVLQRDTETEAPAHPRSARPHPRTDPPNAVQYPDPGLAEPGRSRPQGPCRASTGGGSTTNCRPTNASSLPHTTNRPVHHPTSSSTSSTDSAEPPAGNSGSSRSSADPHGRWRPASQHSREKHLTESAARRGAARGGRAGAAPRTSRHR